MAVTQQFTSGSTLTAANLNASSIPVVSATSDIITPFTGQVIWNTTDGTLYRYTGSAWTALVQGAWTSFTTTWSSSGTQPVINNGAITGAFCVIGKTCFFRFYISMGSTTTFGTGNYSFTLPLTAKNTGVSGNMWPSMAQALDAGTAYRVGISQVSSAATTFQMLDPASGNFYSNTVPQTWAVNDTLAVNMAYEIA